MYSVVWVLSTSLSSRAVEEPSRLLDHSTSTLLNIYTPLGIGAELRDKCSYVPIKLGDSIL